MNTVRATKFTQILLLTIVLSYTGMVTAESTKRPVSPEVSTDFDHELVKQKFVSYFKSEEVGDKFGKKLDLLTAQNQSYCLSLFSAAASELGSNASRRDKHFIALRIYEAFERIDRKEGGALGTVEMFHDKFPHFKNHTVGIKLYQLAKAADYIDAPTSTWKEQRVIEIANIKKENQLLLEKQRDYDKLIATVDEKQKIYDKLNGYISKDKDNKNND